MLSLSNDLLYHLLLPLHPLDLCATLTTCRRIFNIADKSEDRFYRDYWKYQLQKCEPLVNYKLEPKWRFPSYRSLVANQLLRALPLVKLIKLIEGSSFDGSMALHQDDNRGRSPEWIGNICQKDGIIETFGTKVKKRVKHLHLTMTDVLIDIILNEGSNLNRERKKVAADLIFFEDVHEINLYVNHKGNRVCSIMILLSQKSLDICDEEDCCPSCQAHLL